MDGWDAEAHQRARDLVAQPVGQVVQILTRLDVEGQDGHRRERSPPRVADRTGGGRAFEAYRTTTR